jgi:hypothetical protein
MDTLTQPEAQPEAQPEGPLKRWKQLPTGTRRIISLLVLYLWVELLCYVGLQTLGKIGHIHYDPNPTALPAGLADRLAGYLNRLQKAPDPFTTLDPDLGWVLGHSESNSAGMRDNREYATSPAPGAVRISTFGDSFTFGDEVVLGDSWQKQITSIAPSLEMLNYGVRAYGLDQAYLRYTLVGADYHPRIVLIGYMAENLARDVNVYRPFYRTALVGANSYFPLSKPRYEVNRGELSLLRNPLRSPEDYSRFLRNQAPVLRELGRYDYFYQNNYDQGRFDFSPAVRLGKVLWQQLAEHLRQPIFLSDGSYNVKSEAYLVTVGILDAFCRKTVENGALPIIVVFPDSGDESARRQGKQARYASLLKNFAASGYRFIDLRVALDPYASRPLTDLYQRGGHFTPVGYNIVGKYVLAQLQKWNLLQTEGIDQALQSERSKLPR